MTCRAVQVFMSTACLDDELVSLLVEGRASREQGNAVACHVAACSHCAKLVAEVVREDQSDPSARPFEEVGIRGRRRGDVVGDRWRLVRWLGAGRTGSVWEAEDLRGIVRRCAVKLITSCVDARARFRREARLLAGLSHPNIVASYDAFETEIEAVIVLEPLEGQSLSEWISRGPLPFAETIGILRGIARALAFAHGQGVVHRDLKPSNVFVTDASPRLRVLDFGLAAPTHAWAGETVTNLTATEETVGTPLYMAPEQLFGEPTAERSPQVDLWALGLMVHQMLTGSLPFEVGPLGKLLRAIRRAPFERPSARAKVPGGLDDLAQRWLSFDPAGRGDGHAALHVLERVAHEHGVADIW
jgi:serine/threonine-protein kinase